MKKMIGTCLALMIHSTIALADFNYVLVEDFNINYNDPIGDASVSRILFPSGNFEWTTPQVLKITKAGADLVLDNGRQNFVIANAPEFVMSVSKFEVANLNFTAEKTDLSFSFDKFYLFAPEMDNLIDKFRFDCKEGNNRGHYTFFDKIFEGCLTNSTLTSSKVTMIYRDTKSVQMNLFRALVNSVNLVSGGKLEKEESSHVMENIKFRMKNHALTMEMLMHAQISGTVRMGGEGRFEQDKQRFSIRLDRATFGWFDIREEVFGELGKDTSGKIIVERPYIYVKL